MSGNGSATNLSVLAFLAGIYVCAVSNAVADEVPGMDVRVLCRAEAQADLADGAVKTCQADEQRAREVLLTRWTQFASGSRATCVEMATGTAGLQSYVELLSCLDMLKDAKSLPAE